MIRVEGDQRFFPLHRAPRTAAKTTELNRTALDDIHMFLLRRLDFAVRCRFLYRVLFPFREWVSFFESLRVLDEGLSKTGSSIEESFCRHRANFRAGPHRKETEKTARSTVDTECSSLKVSLFSQICNESVSGTSRNRFRFRESDIPRRARITRDGHPEFQTTVMRLMDNRVHFD